MPFVKVTLSILDMNQEIADTEIPSDMTVREIISDISSLLPLPHTDEFGSIIRYMLSSKALARVLMEDETLETAGVPNLDRLVIRRIEVAGGDSKRPAGRIKFNKPSIGLSLDELAAVDTRTLLANEPALMMTLHSYKASLTQLDESHQELKSAEEEIGRLNDRLKEKNIATVLLLLGQIQIGFGTNLVTNGSTGGWFVFLSGLAMNLGALFFSFFGLRRPK